jgi:type IV pilus assembly protein PilN
MRITLNLATRPYADVRPAIKQLRIGMGILAGILLLLGLGLMHFHHSALEMAAKEDAINRQVDRLQREQSGYRVQMQQPANARVLQQAEFLNTIFDEKTFSWTAAMEDLERVLPAGVQVTAIEPARGKDGTITLHLRVSGAREKAVDMVRNMERSKRFGAPRISGENTENNAQGGGFQQVRQTGPARVSFDVLAEYNPATLEERKAEIAAQKRARPETSGPGETSQPAAVRQPYPGPMQGPSAAPGQPYNPAMPRPQPPGGYRPQRVPPRAVVPGGPQ